MKLVLVVFLLILALNVVLIGAVAIVLAIDSARTRRRIARRISSQESNDDASLSPS